MNTIKCLSCGENVQLARRGVHLVCPSCQFEYPLVGGTAPVFLKEPTSYLSQVYLVLDRQVRRDERRASELAGKAADYPLSAARIKTMGAATAHNNQLFEELIGHIEPHLTKRDIAAVADQNATNEYMTMLAYLKRDWCWTATGEEEIRITKGALKSVLDELESLDKAMIMGGGMGRLAFELSTYFEHITVVDYSLGMGYLFHKLMRGDVPIYDITRITEDGQHAVVPRTASIAPEGKGFTKEQQSKITHYVADAEHIPLPDDELSVYFSIYFTDVLPLSEVLPEVKRVLKHGGYYIHFGPLEYHFSKVEEMYSGDELIACFASHGFKLLKADSVIANHCEEEHVFHTKAFKNLVYCFQLDKTPVALTMEDVLQLNQSYQVTREVTKAGEVDTTITFASGKTYEGAELIALIIEEIDGERTIADLSRLFVEKELLPADEVDLLLPILEEFVEAGIFVVET